MKKITPYKTISYKLFHNMTNPKLRVLNIFKDILKHKSSINFESKKNNRAFLISRTRQISLNQNLKH